MIATVLFASLLAALPGVVTRQTGAPAQQQQSAAPAASAPTREASLWLEDANVLTAEMVSGSSSLSGDNWFLLQARLAEAWWKIDQRKAQNFLDSAKGIAIDRISEPPLRGLRRLQIAVTVAECVKRLDAKSSETMLEAILDQAARIGPLAKTMEEKQARSHLASRLNGLFRPDVSNLKWQTKVFRAEMAMDSMRDATWLLFDIYQSDPATGDQLYGEVLDLVVSGAIGVEPLEGLRQLSFPPAGLPTPLKVSPQLTARLLNFGREKILEAVVLGATDENCRPLIPLLNLLTNFPPETRAEVGPFMQECRRIEFPNSASSGTGAPQKLESAEDYLQAAEQASTVQRRASYKRSAIALLSSSNPEEALAVLDGLSPDERASIPDTDFERDHLEMLVAAARLKAKDYSGLQRLIDRSPWPTKTALTIAASAGRDNPEYAASLLPIIIDHIADGKVDDSNFYFMALNYIAVHARTMLPVVFRDTIKGLNQTTEFIPGQTDFPKGKTFMRSSFWWRLEPAPIQSMVDVLEPRVTRLTIDTLKYPMAQASFRLWLLKTELQEYEKALKEQKPAKPLTTDSKSVAAQ